MTDLAPPLLNRRLWMLTGRSDRFVTPALNTGIMYGRAKPDAGVVAARKLLRLGDTTTDYYVAGAMASLVAAGFQAGEDISTLFLPLTQKLRPPAINGGELRQVASGPVRMLHAPVALPAARVWRVTYSAPEWVTVTNDVGYSSVANARTAGGVLYIDWPPETGFDAAIAPDGDVWAPGSRVTISSEPSGYPYAWVAAAARDSSILVQMMGRAGTLSAFHTAQSSIQKVGALTTAVVLATEKANKI